LRGSPDHSIQITGEVVLAGMDCIRLDGTIFVGTTTTSFIRVRDSRTVFESSNTEGTFGLTAGSSVNVPKVTGTVTGNFMGRFGFADMIRIGSGTVNTATTPNRWTFDGTSESYSEPNVGGYVFIAEQNHDRLTVSSTRNLQAANNLKAGRGVMKVAGQGGAVTLTSNPQITGGTDGMKVTLLGTHDTNTLTFVDGNGLQLAGGANFTMGQGDVLELLYDAPRNVWVEISRSDN
jgi:hypothetical protein